MVFAFFSALKELENLLLYHGKSKKENKTIDEKNNRCIFNWRFHCLVYYG